MKWSKVVKYIIQSLVTAPLILKRLSIVICQKLFVLMPFGENSDLWLSVASYSVAHLVVRSLVEAKIINVYL